jgi:hypothetical protein
MSCSINNDAISPKSELVPGEELMSLNISSFIEFETNHLSSTILLKLLKHNLLFFFLNNIQYAKYLFIYITKGHSEMGFHLTILKVSLNFSVSVGWNEEL